MKEVLVLGAGLVVRPIVHYLAEKGYKVVVASRTLDKAEQLVKGAPNAVAKQCDVETEEGKAALEGLITTADAVVSLLPYLLHPYAAKRALAHNKHFLTTSYVSAGMKELEQEAKEKGLVVINECGVDPGTDHMSAMKIVDNVKAKGGKVVSFSSFCGGLPAPQDNNNPFGYKLSWSPRGVLLASRNDALFLEDGKQVTIPGKVLFDNYGTELIEELGIEYEHYPNRNSLQYIDLYGLHDTQKMVRGTYRNKGWCSTIKKLVDMGYLDLDETSLAGQTYAGLTAQLVGSQAKDSQTLRKDVAAFLKLDEGHQILNSFEWLGLFAEHPISDKVNTRLDALCKLMEEKMLYAEGERDMLLMRHTFLVEYPSSGKKEKIKCTLIDYGIPHGDSSMSRTVSLPVAIATRLVLEGKYTTPGLSIPSIPELYNPILDELETLNIVFKDVVEEL